jgi:hypothetical protein
MKGSKVMKSSSPQFVKGGTTKMAGKQSAGPGKFPAGGKTKMAGKQSAKPARAC